MRWHDRLCALFIPSGESWRGLAANFIAIHNTVGPLIALTGAATVIHIPAFVVVIMTLVYSP